MKKGDRVMLIAILTAIGTQGKSTEHTLLAGACLYILWTFIVWAFDRIDEIGISKDLRRG